MTSRHRNAVCSRIVGKNLPNPKDDYDPEETVLDIVSTYKLAKSFVDRPKNARQKFKAMQFMSFLEGLAMANGIDLNQKGEVGKMKRSEIKNSTKTFSAEEVDFYRKLNEESKIIKK